MRKNVCAVIDNLIVVDYLRKFEAEFLKALARESWAQGELFDKKKPKVENLVTLPIKGVRNFWNMFWL
jgi:hypothetical protein